MLKKSVGNFLIKLLIVILIVALQLTSVYFNYRFTYLLENLIYGWDIAKEILITVMLGVASGIACVYLIRRQPKGETGESKAVNTGAIILLCVAALAVALKFVIGTAFWLVPFNILRPVGSELFHWTIESQVPALLLGLAIGGLILK